MVDAEVLSFFLVNLHASQTQVHMFKSMEIASLENYTLVSKQCVLYGIQLAAQNIHISSDCNVIA